MAVDQATVSRIKNIELMLGVQKQPITQIYKAFNTNQNTVFVAPDTFTFNANENIPVGVQILLYKQTILGFNGIYSIQSENSPLVYTIKREVKSTDLDNVRVNLDNVIYKVYQDKDDGQPPIKFELRTEQDYADIVDTVTSLKETKEDKSNKIPTPRISGSSGKRKLKFNTPIPTTPYLSTVSLKYSLPITHTEFLKYSPFIELRMYQSNVKRFKNNFKNRNRMTSPANPNGFVLGFSNKYKGAGNVDYKQITEVKLEDGVVLFDNNTNQFANLTDQGFWDPDTNTPDLNGVSPTIGDFWICSNSGNTNMNEISSWVTGDRIYWDGSEWQRIRSLSNPVGSNNIRRFDFNPHDFFGNASNIHDVNIGNFKFPVLQSTWNNDSGASYRNRRSIGGNSGYSFQVKFDNLGNELPDKSKCLVIGMRIGCIDPSDPLGRNLIFGEDSNLLAIRPTLCKQSDSSNNYYYDWEVVKAK